VPTVIDRRRLRRLLDDENAQLVEVLPKAEFDEEHLPGAVHLPLKQLDGHAAARTLDAGRPVVVYCWDGL
jgi:rhodanese-related sulfurtransferase